MGRQRFLLTGDIEEGIDPILLARGLPRLDLLKVAHHGSRTSSTGAFLDAVRPRLAVVSAGVRNPYGHPAPATLARLAERGVRLFRTDREGSVEVTLDGLGRLKVHTDRRAAGLPAATSGPPRAVAPRSASGLAFTCGIPLGG